MRGLRRRRMTVTAMATVAAIALLGAGGVVVADNLRGDDGVQLSDAAAYEQHGVWMADGALHVGNHTVDIDAKINAVYYTSAGVVVRSGPTGDRPTGPDDGWGEASIPSIRAPVPYSRATRWLTRSWIFE